MRLVIAEKPSLARAIADVLPGRRQNQDGCIVIGDTTVVWCYGHLLALEEPEFYDEKHAGRWKLENLPIVVPAGAWKQRPRKEKSGGESEKQLRLILTLLKRASDVVHAGDADREGQLVVEEVLEYAGWKGKTTRLLVQDTTPDGVRKAQAKAQDNTKYRPLYEAAVSRARADWLVGMNFSRALGARVGRPGMSVGRVQTPTLALVVRRDREIEGFASRAFYTIEATVDSNGGVLVMLHDDAEQRIVDPKEAKAIADALRGQHVKLKVERKEQKEGAPLPFMLASFQKAAEAAYGWSAKESLSVVQSLYEKQHATYPRTDCPYLPADHAKEAVPLAKAILSGGYCGEAKGATAVIAPSPGVYDDKKVAEHHALVPTAKIPSSSLDKKLLDGWKLIASRFLQSLLPAYRAEITLVSFDWQGRAFVARGERGLNTAQSWRVLDPKQKVKPLELKRDPTEGNVTGAEVKKGETKPPKRYTEATLIEAMRNVAKIVTDPAIKAKLKETAGIGTAATQADAIETLKKRGFIAPMRGKSIISTALGRYVVDACPPVLCDPGITALWEQSLDKIAAGEYEPAAFMRGIDGYVAKHVAHFANAKMPDLPAEAAAPAATRPRGRSKSKIGTRQRKGASR